jgi:hypothetical protein
VETAEYPTQAQAAKAINDAVEQTRENPSMWAKRRSTNDVARMRTTRTDDENKCRGEMAKASTMSMKDGKMGTPQTNDSLTSACMTRTNDSVASTLRGENKYDENECRGKGRVRVTNDSVGECI